MDDDVRTIIRGAGRRVRAITVAEQAVQANALGLLVGMCPDVEVVAAEPDITRARASILRNRPDVVVIRAVEERLNRFKRLLDLQHTLPGLGFVIILSDREGGDARQAPSARSVTVLSAQFSVPDLWASTLAMGSTHRWERANALSLAI